jgi:hypothetical protein
MKHTSEERRQYFHFEEEKHSHRLVSSPIVMITDGLSNLTLEFRPLILNLKHPQESAFSSEREVDYSKFMSLEH